MNDRMPLTKHELKYLRSRRKLVYEKSVKNNALWCVLIDNQLKLTYFGDTGIFEWKD